MNDFSKGLIKTIAIWFVIGCAIGNAVHQWNRIKSLESQFHECKRLANRILVLERQVHFLAENVNTHTPVPWVYTDEWIELSNPPTNNPAN